MRKVKVANSPRSPACRDMCSENHEVQLASPVRRGLTPLPALCVSHALQEAEEGLARSHQRAGPPEERGVPGKPHVHLTPVAIAGKGLDVGAHLGTGLDELTRAHTRECEAMLLEVGTAIVSIAEAW